MPDRERNAVVGQKAEVAPGLIIVRVAPRGWELPEFRPGQFAVLGLPGAAPRVEVADAEEPTPDPRRIISRAYSIASSSRAREYLEFYVALVTSGALTPRLFRLSVGDALWLGPKITGRFTLDEVPDDAHVALVGTGTGVAPYVSMIRSLLDTSTRRRIAVVHGARHSWDLGYSAELTSLARICPTLTYVPAVSRPDEESMPWTGATGYVQDVWSGGLVARHWGFEPTPGNTHVLLCGNPGMIGAMEQILQRQGYREHNRRAAGQYHLERYW